MEYGLIFSISACVIGLIMVWGVGANDLANILSTARGSRAISARQALVIAIIFEFAGALLGGVHVSNTIRNGIIDVTLFSQTTNLLIDGMLATLLASMVWMIFASFIGMPVSITNAIVGALVGFGAIVLGIQAIHWKMVSLIAMTWILAPLIAGFMSYFLFLFIKKFIMATSDPYHQARYYMPIFFFLIGITFALMVVLKDLSSYGLNFSIWYRILITLFIAFVMMIIGFFLCFQLYFGKEYKSAQEFVYVEKLFGTLMLLTACAMVFAHGSNDVAIATGPIAVVLDIVRHHGQETQLDHFPIWIVLMGCLGVLAGLIMYGRKVIRTVGKKITFLTPSRAFAATIAAAMTVILSTNAGLPVSATQTLVGGVFGVGLAGGIGALNLRIIRNILLSWIITVPICTGLAILFFYILQFVILLH